MIKSKFLVLMLCFTTFSLFSQQNSFPPNGKVGIGTLNPSARLDVNGKVHIDSSLLVKDSVIIKKSLLVEDKLTVEKGVIIQDNLIVEKNVYIPNIEQVVPGNNGNGNGLGVNANLYKPLYIDGNGKIFRLNGALTPVGDGDTDDNPCVNPATNSRWEIGLNKIFVRCPNVNVGINTTTPRVKMDVIGTSYAEKLVAGNINPSTVGNNLLYLKSPTNFTIADKLISVNNASAEILSLNNEGTLETKRIVIGANNPTSNVNKLLYLKAPSAYTNADKLVSINNSYDEEIASINNEGTLETKKINVHGRLHIHTDITRENPDVIDIFGIWSLSGKLLQVNSDGLLLVREIKLNQTWGDYVFEKKYPLMPLSELENYVQKHKHLPRVPSAETIETEGIGLGETNRIFIEKIEETTLYVIELYNEVKALKLKVEEQEREIETLKNNK